MTTTALTPRFRDLFPPALRIWLTAKFFSDAGSALNTIIIGIYALETTGSAVELGIILALKLCGTILGGSLAAPITSRFGNRALMISADFLASILLLLFVFSQTNYHSQLIYPLVVGLGIGRGAFHVALYSEVPSFVGLSGRHLMNAVLSAIEGMGIVVGSIAASILSPLLSYSAIFTLDAATFIASGVTLSFLGYRIPRPIAETSNVINEKQSLRVNRLKKWPETWAMIRMASTVLPLLLLVRFAEAFGSAAHNVGFPILSKMFDPAEPAYLFGWIMAAWGFGRLLSASFVPKILTKVEARKTSFDLLFVLLVIITFLLFITVFSLVSFGAILIFAMITGIFDAATETVYYSTLQRAPDRARSSLVALSYVIERFGMGLGMISVGVVFAAIGLLNGAYLYYGASIILAVAVLSIIKLFPGTR